MTDITRIKDSSGKVHYTARDSQAAERLLRDGAEDLDAPREPEVTDATEPPAQGDDQNTGATDSGPADGERTARPSRRGNRSTGEA